MSAFPITTATPYRFTPLVDQIEKARDAVAKAERDLANASAADEANSTEGTKADVVEKSKKVEAAEKALADLENELAANPQQPVYLLRVPTFDLNALLEDEVVRMPTYPGDRKMLRAIEASGMIASDDPDLVRIKEALKKTGGSLPEEMAGVFEDLYDRASDTAAVGAIRAARLRWTKAIAKTRTRFFLCGFQGVLDLDGAVVPFLTDADGRPTDQTINAIAPDDVSAIGEKVQELNSLRSRRGNSRGGANSSASPQPSPPTPTDSGNATTETATEQ